MPAVGWRRLTFILAVGLFFGKWLNVHTGTFVRYVPTGTFVHAAIYVFDDMYNTA
jgi:hypothetical protein